MKTSLKQTESQTTFPPLHLPDAASAVEDALMVATTYCADKMRLDSPASAIDRMRNGDGAAFSYTHYSLAMQVGEALGNLDRSVESVYLLDYDATIDDLCFGSEAQRLPIHLLVRAARKTPALTSLVAAFDRALTQRYAGMIGPQDLVSVLDVLVVDNDDLQKRTGAAALLSSLHNPPMPVWAR